VLLSCRAVVFLPCLPVLLFCRFCRAVLRAAIRTATRLITCVVATGTLPIRTAWWIYRWVTCTQVEYDYYADGAPVVSCAVRAAMSGRRQTRPPAILGEVDNCKCNACVWRRAHEATLPAGKQNEPIRRRPTPVGPRRSGRPPAVDRQRSTERLTVRMVMDETTWDNVCMPQLNAGYGIPTSR
jgi:hypothetical protein